MRSTRRQCTPWSLADVAERLVGQGRPGAAVFRTVVEGRAAELPPVGSDAELVLAEALRVAGMPSLSRQFPVMLGDHGPIRLDLAVPADRFDIEIDDPMWHADPVALCSAIMRAIFSCRPTAGSCSASRPTTCTSASARPQAPSPRSYFGLISRRLCA